MIEQIASFHNTSPAIHIGCDEVFQLGVCNDCKGRMGDRVWSKAQLFSAHVNRVAVHVKSVNPLLRVLIWDDMLRACDVVTLESSRLKETIEPMVWFYGAQGFPDIWSRYSAVFPTIWCASAFKGASGPTATIPDLSLRVANQQAWQAVIEDNATRVTSWGGFVLTGWSRYDHFGVLCELLPSALPSLVLCLTILNHGKFTPETHALASKEVGYPEGSLISVGELKVMPSVDLHRSVPAAAIWLNSIRQAILCNAFKKFVGSDLFCGWFHQRNIAEGRLSRGVVDQLLGQVEQLIEDFDKLIFESQCLLPDVFDSAICEEWMDTHCRTYLHKLRKISNKMEQVLQFVR
uniref:Beta-N-acetylhexosaminidase n=1 Tax=Plectus sambesii TaxID=2011161 RepID=A0A914W270_9BILA